MKQTKKKLCSIIGELTTFFFTIGAGDFSIRVSPWEDGYRVEASCRYDPACRRQVERMEQLLHAERNDGIEEAYWELAGVSDLGADTELTLLGQMVDRAELTVEEDRLAVTLFKRTE